MGVGESRNLSAQFSSAFNLKAETLDSNRANFRYEMGATSSFDLNDTTITALDYGNVDVTITHIPTGTKKQVTVVAALIADSIVQGIRDRDLADGEYLIYIKDEEYLIELYNYYDDVTYSSDTSLGNATADQRMLVVKYHGDLKIEEGITVTAANRKKGMYVCVLRRLKK